MEVVNGDFLGGGIVLAVAAVLWIVYLVPTLWRKHNFDATEKNAVRLNQTIRALVETSETPQELRVEATARAVAQQQRVLRKAEAEAQRQLRAATLKALPAEIQTARILAHRRRERRAATTLLLGSLGVTGWGAFALATAGAWGFLAGGIVGLLVSVTILRNINAGRTRDAIVTRGEERDVRRRIPERETTAQGWQPATVPAPLTSRAGSLARTTVDAELAAAQRRRNAAIDAAVAAATGTPQLGAESARPTPQQTSRPAAPVSPSRTSGIAHDRLAAMGKVGDTGDVAIDLTDALRRRRTGS